MRVPAPLLVATHLGVAGLTYYNTDRRPVDTEVRSDGYADITTTKVLAATVASLREENKLLVFSYRGSASVQAQHDWLWVFQGRQQLIVPAVINYYVDLSRLDLGDLDLDERQQIVRVKLPPVTLGDIAFEPEKATTINGGVLTWGEGEVEALRKLNYGSARRAMVAQAQGRGLLNAAQRQARANVESMFRIPLRIAGKPGVEVVARFE